MKYAKIIFIAVLLWGSFLRLYGIDQESYWIDEAYSISIGQAIVDHGYPLLDSGETVWRAPLYHYALAGSIKVFGSTELATRGISIAIGIASIILLAIIARTWISERAGIITAVMVSLLYWMIAWSRQARMYMMLLFFFWLTLFLYERWRSTKHKRYFWLTILSMVAAVASHRFGLFVVLAITLHMLVEWLHSRKIKPTTMILSYLFGTIGIVVATVVVIQKLYYAGPLINYWNHYQDFLIQEYFTLFFLAAVGLSIAIWKEKQQLVLWLFAVVITGMGIFSYAIPLLHYRYILFLVPGVILLAAYAIDWVLHFRWYGIVVVFFIIAGSTEFIIEPQVHWPLESDTAHSSSEYKSFTPQPDFAAAYELIESQQPTILVTPFPSMTRLYLDRDDSKSLYVDLTGRGDGRHDSEVYTGVSLLNGVDIGWLQEQSGQGLLLLDTLSRKRINPELRSYIEQELTHIYTHSAGPWSQIDLYQL